MEKSSRQITLFGRTCRPNCNYICFEQNLSCFEITRANIETLSGHLQITAKVENICQLDVWENYAYMKLEKRFVLDNLIMSCCAVRNSFENDLRNETISFTIDYKDIRSLNRKVNE